MFPATVVGGTVDVMVALWNEGSRADALALASELRARRASRRHLSRGRQAREAVQVRVQPERAIRGDRRRRRAGAGDSVDQGSAERRSADGRPRRRGPARGDKAAIVTSTYRRNRDGANDAEQLSDRHLWGAPRRPRRPDGAARGLGESEAGPRQLLFIDLRDHYGITQCVFTPDSQAFAIAEAVRLESVIAVEGRVIGAHGGERQPRAAHRRRRGGGRSRRGPVAGGDAAVPGGRDAGDSGRAAAALPLPRSAPREAARQHRAARAGDFEHPPADERAGLSRSSRRRSSPRARPKGRATTSCRAGSIRASSTRCRRRRSSSSSC